MTPDQITHMAECFLSWRLPADFNPDGGVAKTGDPRIQITGTNLLTYHQAEAMVRHMTKDLPQQDVATGKNYGYRGDGMDFGQAVAALKEGSLVAREGWNGKGMFVYLVPGSTFAVNRPPLLGIYQEGTVIDYQPHIDIKGADGLVSTWAPSIGDVLANDWAIVTGTLLSGM